MNRQEAIKILKAAQTDKFPYDSGLLVEAMDMAISSLETDEAYQLEYERTTKNDLGVECISREQAKAAIRDKFKDLPSRVEINTILNELPSVTPQEPKWIPVEEKLPEDRQNVLFCDIDNDIMVGYHIKGRSNTHFSQDGTFEDMKNVRAWMLLPKPYEPQESEDKE